MEQEKELIRLASLVGTDTKDPETKLLKHINKHYIPRGEVAKDGFEEFKDEWFRQFTAVNEGWLLNEYKLKGKEE